MIAVLFIVGFFTWLLALARLVVWEKEQTTLLMLLVFTEEMFAAGILVYLSRFGAWYEIVAYALGGMTSVLVAMKLKRRKHAR